MESLYLLIPLSVVVVFFIGIAFWWSVRNGQFDDLEGPGYRIVMDDDTAPTKAAGEALENAPAAAPAGETAPSGPGEKAPASVLQAVNPPLPPARD